ncbi:unnamed protein product [Medioppia subpectinata]|uniref:WD repeat-containing protein 11 n=1 Tax=Medioppia subpectinata TaxID=1979941 RepID=A0A7R9Q453_9ACAR|nr:unnamed protein product [Medioppia subpectinata]CAG2111089.1 unnamed protein product [Medioppia subpectinata]
MSSSESHTIGSNDALSSAKRADTTPTADQTSLQKPVIQNISPRTISGVLSQWNQKAIDWSLSGLIAIGSHNRVVVVDALHGLKLCQSMSSHESKRNQSFNSFLSSGLHRHNHSVCLIRWCHSNDLKLCSVDTTGTIIIWDVSEGSVLTLITATKELKSIQAIEWLELKSADNICQNYLLVLNRNNGLTLLDTEFGEIIWTKNFDITLKSISLDPFCANNILFGIQSKDCCFATVDDLRANGCANRSLKYYSIVSNSGKNPPKSTSALNYSLLAEKVVSSDTNVMSDWIQICYHKSVPNQVLVAISRQILVIDLSIEAIICCVPLERNCSNITNVFSCQNRNAFFICHDFGTVSLRLFQKQVINETNEMAANVMISYANVCQSDGLRLTKQNKIFGYCLSPSDETKVALLLNNGRIIIKKVHKMGTKANNESICLPYIYDMITTDEYIASEQKKCKTYRMLMTQMSSAINFSPHVIRMCPPVTMRNWQFHRPLLAVGDSSGSVQIWNLSLSSLDKEFGIHSFPVRGLEWTGLDAFISFAYPNISPHSGKTNNELNITEVNSGTTYPLRTERNMDSSPIESLRISHLKQYLIISFKDDPFEIWDLKSLSLLRVMPKQFSAITAIEWSPLYTKRTESQNHSSNAMTFHSKENFVVTNTTGELYHFSIEGNIVKEITCIPPDTEMSANITCIAWKSDQVLLGDAVGNLNVWDLKKKVSRIEPTHRGPIKKMRFGPGRGNMKFLMQYNDGVDIWDTKDFKLNAQLKHPRDMNFKVVDIDWAASDRPVLCTSEGTVLVTDMKLRQYSSSMSELLANQTDTEYNDLNSVNFYMLSSMSRFIFKSKLFLNEWNGGPKLPDCEVERNILIAKLFNDYESFHFWNIVSYALFDNKERLDRNNDLFLDNKHYKDIQFEKVSLLDLIRSNYNQNKICYEMHLLLNEPQRAVQLLLESDSSMSDYYVDALKACLITSLQSNDSSAHPVIKLVATNLIANGRVGDGSQLLCLIGKTQDACRYLQSANKWLESVCLAKCTLEGEEYVEIMRRWAEHLISQSNYKTAVFIFISLKQYIKAIQTLLKLNIETTVLPKVLLIMGSYVMSNNVEVPTIVTTIYEFSLLVFSAAIIFIIVLILATFGSDSNKPGNHDLEYESEILESINETSFDDLPLTSGEQQLLTQLERTTDQIELFFENCNDFVVDLVAIEDTFGINDRNYHFDSPPTYEEAVRSDKLKT